MDTSEYIGMFLAESREHLQTLNLAIIRIEETPSDSATIDEIFRIAHSLKGMSGTMGFARMAALTHTMEDVFETLRGRTGALERRVIDVLLECLDALEAAVEAIARDGDEQLDPTALIARLTELVRHPSEDVPAAAAAAAAPAGLPEAVAAFTADVPLVRVTVALAADVMMPAVRAYMVLSAVADHGEMVWSSPTVDDVDSFAGSAVDAWVATEHEPATLEAAVRAVPDVHTVTAEHAQASAEPASPRPFPRPRRHRPRAPHPHARRARSPRRARACRTDGAIDVGDRSRRRGATRPAHALHGRARRAPHAGRVARRQDRASTAWPRRSATSPAARSRCRRS